ncbi:MAG: DNA alkylation repair protein [Clostridiales bacterium]|nr:DNA alkylation repair protein [Clostridiales bacterium]
MTYEEILRDLNSIENRKTKDIDKYDKGLIKAGADVSCLKDYVPVEPLLHRTYFQVSLGEFREVEDQFQFIEDNEDLLQDWWHVDQLTQFMIKPIDFDFAFSKATQYVNSPKPFVRRWGYVLFLTGLQKEKSHTAQILSLMKDDDEYYVQMAEAWLIADLAVFNADEVVRFIGTAGLKYNIMGKAIQKICDSYRISHEMKKYLKSLRGQLKKIGGREVEERPMLLSRMVLTFGLYEP